MKVIFLHHSGFFVQTEYACFLFDYWGGQDAQTQKEVRAMLPGPGTMPLFIFASHWHHDHFDPEIFRYGQMWKDVRWILSDDILPERIPESVRDRVTRVSAHEAAEVALSGESVLVQTLRSTDSGVAFLVRTREKVLYHAGDLHLWLWRESESEDRKMQEAFEKEIEALRGLSIDAAFLPLDPRQYPEDVPSGLDISARLAKIGRIYPMHCWGDFSIIDRLVKSPCSLPYKHTICMIGKDGQTDEI